MSGGSYNYLCWASTPQELGARYDTIRDMADDLAAFGPEAAHAAAATKKVVTALDNAAAVAKPINAVWKAMEWYHSSDWGRDRLVDALRTYEQENPGDERCEFCAEPSVLIYNGHPMCDRCRVLIDETRNDLATLTVLRGSDLVRAALEPI